ncbi:hypothetical protein HGT73_00825 [Rosenbergiella australiborealis]|uniref:WavE lipopolysaccharide synthesis n=1 Tax=Rosenbergiella australiborealis TaxID=1544696 RepID=A0ABS5T384_9GAMM|nr:WavE lipopolysaccharide synthesis family protein [Rosenbergiella australiborealis]MBT0725940.1 hypothetical protein [Rosenbergiella australiborealis]
MVNNISVIIHGPLEEDFLEKNLNAIYRQLKNAKVIISTYKKDAEKVNILLKKTKNYTCENIEVLSCDDVFNPGFFNINRQINLVNAALDAIDKESFIIKVRMDQTINFTLLMKLVNVFSSDIKGKLITTNCYTRADRWYHPSDMLLAGDYKILRDYYPVEFFRETHMDNILLIRELVKSNHVKDFHSYWPESRLFTNFVKKRGDIIKESAEDSLEKLKTHVFVINSWDISLKWKKFLKGWIPVLPYTFKMAPFRDGPEEDAYNFKASDLNRVPSKNKESMFIRISKIYFKTGMYHFNPLFFSYRKFLLRVGRKAFDISLKFIPPIFHRTLVTIGRKFYYAIK